MTKTPRFFLEHIVEAANTLAGYVENVTLEAFVSDSMRYNATIRMIAIIGEAISRLEDDFRESHPDIPWKQIKAMRNFLIHEYWQTDLEQVYISSTQEIPELIGMIEKTLAELDE